MPGAQAVSNSVGVKYIFDANGNLLSDGVNTYTYDSANRLISFVSPSGTVSYRYNGMGDRLQEITNGQTITFTMDLAAGLTQTLDDGTHAYLYGNDRIAQVDTTGTEYFLGDALGSVRQLTDEGGELILAKTCDPYGVLSATSGAGATSYGFTREFQDSYNQMVYWRTRIYAPSTVPFLNRDTWQEDYNTPLSHK